MKKLALILIALATAMSAIGVPAQGSVISSTSLKIYSFEGVPFEGAKVSAIGLPQTPQVTSSSGETSWLLSGGSTHSFTVDARASRSRFAPTFSFVVNVFIPENATGSHVVKLPKVRNVSLPLSEADSYGADLIIVGWDGMGSAEFQLEVDGKARTSIYSPRMQETLEIVGGPNARTAQLSYFEPQKLAWGQKDIDGDLVPDHRLLMRHAFGTTSYELLSRTLDSKPPTISLAQSFWINAIPGNEFIDLALMQGNENVTAKFPGGFFEAHSPINFNRDSGGFASGVTVSGSQAKYSWAPPGSIRNFVFTYKVNNLTLGLSSPVSVDVKNVTCYSKTSGYLRSLMSLGQCASGFTLSSTIKKLSEKRFSSCIALNKVLVGGVGRNSAFNLGKRPLKGWLEYSKGYANNKHLDTDKDGIACEK